MAPSQLTCPKCNGAMEVGYVVDQSQASLFVSHWCKGPPQKSFWRQTKVPDVAFPIGMYRCSSCGYLEAYAADEFAAQ